jgi:hypothetical protein
LPCRLVLKLNNLHKPNLASRKCLHRNRASA